jgi:antitoxin (DNA-binding transcriptional repressor) of toxin-antitoxin stability system
MTTISIEQAQADLAGLIARMGPGEECLITQRGRTVARLVAEQAGTRQRRRAGSAVGKLTVVEEDDAHLDDFKEYMP